MPQICKVCVHPDRAVIDAELSKPESKPLREMAEEYGLSKDSILRHFQNHLPHDDDSPIATSELVTNRNIPSHSVAVFNLATGEEARQENLLKPEFSSHARAREGSETDSVRFGQKEENPSKLEVETRHSAAPDDLEKPRIASRVREGTATSDSTTVEQKKGPLAAVDPLAAGTATALTLLALMNINTMLIRAMTSGVPQRSS